MTILAAVTAVSALPAVAQGKTAAAPASVQRVDANKVIGDVRKLIAANYVLPDLRPKLDAALAHSLASGRYRTSDPAELAQRINADMAAVAQDKHLRISFDPQQQARLAAEPPVAVTDDAPVTEEEIRQASRFNYGIMTMKVLPGNVRYLDIQQFFWAGQRTQDAFDNAIRFLSGGDAIVIDLRRNGGGDSDAVRYLISHFVAANQPLVTFYEGTTKVVHESSLDVPAADRLTGKPLYVLTSGNTASAAEEFTGHVAGYHLGEIIGDPTAGGSFNNHFYAVDGGYVLSLSIGRAVLASTGKDWEGVGIHPTIRVDPDQALDVAQLHAWQRIAENADGPRKRFLEAQATALEARLHPVATALPLANYAGTYGDRSITVNNGALVFARAGGPQAPMIAIGANEFTLADNPMVRVRFTVVGNSATALEVLRPEGTSSKAERTR